MKQKGFTLIELLVVIAIIGVMSSIVYSSISGARIKARDAKRLSDMRTMQMALEFYYDKYGQYPPIGNNDCSGWDTIYDGTFITPLVNEGLLGSHLTDTIVGQCGNYRYVKYAAGSNGCPVARGPYYVLGVVNMEGTPTDTNHPSSPGFGIAYGCTLNWGECTPPATCVGLEWVTGAFEK